VRLGPWEIALIVVIVVLLFGSKRIPDILRGLGQGIREFKAGMRDEPPKSDESKPKDENQKEVK
jgi:sec-independent protein translocase protein TatA